MHTGLEKAGISLIATVLPAWYYNVIIRRKEGSVMRKLLVVCPPDALPPIPAGDYEVLVCHNAREAAQLLHREFDGLVLDLFLPGTDGLTLLETMQEQLPPVVLVLTRYFTDYILQSVESLCGGYVLRTPCPSEEICHRLEDMFCKFESPAVNTALPSARYHLRRMGLSPAKRGFHCAVFILSGLRPESDPCLFTDYYPALAEKYAVTTAAIDNAIHREIERAYHVRNDAIWQEYLPDTSQCPKNKEFLCAVAERIR